MLIAFKNTSITKPIILKQLRAHLKADAVVKGRYWKDGKGCAVGCTIHSSNHAEYEGRFGIPQMLAYLEDCIFEGLPNGHAQKWPIRFIDAVKPGTDLSRVAWKFLHWLLTDKEVNPGINHPLVRGAIKECADLLLLLTKGQPINAGAARSAEGAAWSAACAAWSARGVARSAAWIAEGAAACAAWIAEGAAWSAARGVARDVARSAACAARSAARGVARDAEGAAYIRMSNKLVTLIKAAPRAVSRQGKRHNSLKTK